ncbi:segregation and condensation protein A [Roseiflexus castenholzii]|jgi:segregation and condensation protein A|uniref:Segregation and condensation protein A n=1 Tax=Roseiflexus castenholzii (strain DSM 13941 / HLO8) TaxID=383372 RepID=A7NS23_ROSCS|nr:segregation/condensation protein A [Roseiflexus castenholzii]ABU60369.1 chromosome segregation and condensation protein ScpA [Roseiflexus castenholzii DSM 13941]
MFIEPIDYTVTLPIFEGPLDLLLRLIEREELDVTGVALAHVADQYLAHVRTMDAPDPASLSAFLVVAARLMLLKSRALLPRPSIISDQEPDDEGESLVRQLQEYQRFRRLAALLRRSEGQRMYPRLAMPPAPRPARLDHTIADLIAAMQRRMQLMLPLDPPPMTLPAPKMVTVGEMIDRIRSYLQERPWVAFEEMIALAAHRVEIVVAFWAVLELWKRHVVVVEQAGLFGVIVIRRGVLFGKEELRTETRELTG